MSTYRVAKDTGISQTLLSDWKNGRSTPKIDKIELLASYFDVSVAYLQGKTEIRNPVTALDGEHQQVVLDSELLEILENLRTRPEMKTLFSLSKNASPADIQKTIRIIEALKEG